MKSESTSGSFAFALRVNDVEFHEASLRFCEELSADFEVVVRDPTLGNFALHEGFLMEIRDEKIGWRPISFAELKIAVLKQAEKSAGGTYSWRLPLECHSEPLRSRP